MLVDAFEPTGIARIAKDSVFMMPHLGVLSSVVPGAGEEVFERDCLVELGTCAAPVGRGRPGRRCLDFELERGSGGTESGSLAFGDLRAIPLAAGESARLVLSPARGFDVGAGRGRSRIAEVDGGPCGVIIDCRGRPIAWPDDHSERRSRAAAWLAEVGATGGGGGE